MQRLPLLRGLRPGRISDVARYRWLEMLPGALVWLSLAGAILIAFLQPIWAIAFVIVFDVFWLIRIVYVMTYLVMAFRRFRRAEREHWLSKLEAFPQWRNIYHAIMIPVATEGYPVLRETFASLNRIEYPHDRIILVVATEARYQSSSRPAVQRVLEEYGKNFFQVITTEHPSDLPGEVAGKGSNIAWAGHELQRRIDAWQIPYGDVLVSTFDADSVAHPQYFSYLTYTFLNHPNRLRTSYQPIPLFHNNAWDSLPLMRVVATSTTFWLLSETMRPDRLLTFSSHSMPFRALVDVGFWQTDVVSEDSRIFIQCFLRYDGEYTVTPMYIPISMDVVQAPGWWRSIVNQYKQIRRWAYGVENFPFLAWNFIKTDSIPIGKKLRYLWNQLEGAYSWAVAPLIILILGWLPFQTNRALIESSILAQNAPVVLQRLMLVGMVGAFVSAVLSLSLLPRRPRHVRKLQWVTMAGQWLLVPITMIVFGSVPAIESQTRLMLGRYLGFWVTEKTRRS